MAQAMKVEDVMTPHPYTVTPGAPLDEVASAMSRRKIGSAVVVEGGRVVGVFTTVDALRLLSALLAEEVDR
jgi:acetoin utilization protein AcuB